MHYKRHGRKKPYTEAGIKRLPCICCGEPAEYQWNICSDNNLWRPLCVACDIKANAIFLKMMKDPDMKLKLAAYCKSKGII
jgi:hypothetical protein